MCNVNSNEIKEFGRISKENEDNSKKEIEKLQQENDRLKLQLSTLTKDTEEKKLVSTCFLAE